MSRASAPEQVADRVIFLPSICSAKQRSLIIDADATCAVRLKPLAISAMGCCLFVLVQVAAAGPSNDACDLPNDLQHKVASKYPGKKVVTLADLQDDDKFKKITTTAAPVWSRLNFTAMGSRLWPWF